jgi:hypothetical protein
MKNLDIFYEGIMFCTCPCVPYRLSSFVFQFDRRAQPVRRHHLWMRREVDEDTVIMSLCMVNLCKIIYVCVVNDWDLNILQDIIIINFYYTVMNVHVYTNVYIDNYILHAYWQ